MNYWEYSVEGLGEEEGEVLVARIAAMGFESFMWEKGEKGGGGVQKCYINSTEHYKYAVEIEKFLQAEDYQYKLVEIEARNWNAVWESDFQPIMVGDVVCVRTPEQTKSQCRYEVIIVPNMSFGTGHHPTTYMMLEKLEGMKVGGKKVLDVGCGSGVLGIFAMMLGAREVVGCDIDRWSVESARWNVGLNCVEMSVVEGDVSCVCGEVDVIVANINRNVLVGDMKRYGELLVDGGELLLSGFLEEDIDILKGCAKDCELKFKESMERKGWFLLHFYK